MQDPLQDTTRRDQVVMKSRRKHEGENRKRGGGERGRPGWWLTLRHRVTLTPSLLPRQLLHGIARYQRRNVFQLLQRAFEYRTGVRQSFVCVSHTHTHIHIYAHKVMVDWAARWVENYFAMTRILYLITMLTRIVFDGMFFF